jgi:hypothetical protein
MVKRSHVSPLRSYMQISNILISKSQVKSDTWWAPLWRGLVVPQGYKHYKAMGSAIWLFSYLLLHADRKTGRLIRKLDTIAREMEMNKRTIRYWISRLRKHGYITTKHTGRSLEIFIQKWKPLQRATREKTGLRHQW